MNQFDAILFFIGHWTVGHISLPNQYNRKSSQYYVMFLMEGPLNERFPYEKYKNFFNWTMTYRRDSDFYTPYGWIAPKYWEWHYPPVEPVNWKQYMNSGIILYLSVKPRFGPSKKAKCRQVPVLNQSWVHLFNDNEVTVTDISYF